MLIKPHLPSGLDRIFSATRRCRRTLGIMRGAISCDIGTLSAAALHALVLIWVRPIPGSSPGHGAVGVMVAAQ